MKMALDLKNIKNLIKHEKYKGKCCEDRYQIIKSLQTIISKYHNLIIYYPSNFKNVLPHSVSKYLHSNYLVIVIGVGKVENNIFKDFILNSLMNYDNIVDVVVSNIFVENENNGCLKWISNIKSLGTIYIKNETIGPYRKNIVDINYVSRLTHVKDVDIKICACNILYDNIHKINKNVQINIIYYFSCPSPYVYFYTNIRALTKGSNCYDEFYKNIECFRWCDRHHLRYFLQTRFKKLWNNLPLLLSILNNKIKTLEMIHYVIYTTINVYLKTKIYDIICDNNKKYETCSLT